MLTLFKDPFFNGIDKVIDSYYSNSYSSPRTNINKTDDGYNILISVPGLTKDDLRITVDNGILFIEYEKEEKNENSHFMESFSKSYKLPDNIKDDDIKGTVKDGILSLKLPYNKKKMLQKQIELQ